MARRFTFNRKLIEEKEYWVERLSSVRGLAHLKADQSAPAADRDKFTFTFSPDLLPKILKLTGDSQLLLYAAMLGALKVCLYKYTENKQIVVGSPPRLKNSDASPAPNALAIIDQVDSSMSFRQLLLQVRETLLAAYANQTFPYEQLIKAIEIEDTEQSPLLDVVLSLNGFHGELCQIKNNLEIVLERSGDRLTGHVDFNSRLYRRESVALLMQHWSVLLDHGLENMDSAIGRLEMLDENERRLLSDWGGPKREAKEECLTDVFSQQVQTRPNDVALVWEQTELTYAELETRANQLAHYLQARGVSAERLVGFCLDRTPDLVIAQLAILKAGGAYLPLDPASPPQRLAFMLADAGAVLVLTDAVHHELLADSSIPRLRLDLEASAIAAESSETLSDVAVAPSQAAYVIYTSGSTGQPKGVVVTHGNVTRLLRITHSQFDFDHRDVWTLFHSSAFDFSVWEIWGALAHGGKLVIVPYLVSRSPDSFLQLLRAQRVTVLNQTPSAFQQLIQVEAAQSSANELALRVVIFGGEALDPSTLAQWAERHGYEHPQLVNMYGITETTVHVTFHRVEPSEVQSPLRRSVIGRGIDDLSVYVVDPQLNLVPVGVRGEIYVGGAGVSRGYLGRSSLTAQRYVPDWLGAKPGGRLYRTGDRGRWTRQGELEYEGRIDAQVKIRGYRIELGEIEALLGQHETVSEALVLVSERDDHRLLAYVVPAKYFILNVSELQGYLKQRLPDYMVPASFMVLDAFPLTVNGKIDRRALPEPEQERRLNNDFREPETRTEKLLANIWKQVLRVEEVGANDSFFELGGHSLLATQVMLRIRETFAVELPLRELFERPTIAALGQSIDAQKQVETHGPPLVAVSRDTDLPLSYAQQRIWFLDQLQPGTPLYNMSFTLRLVGGVQLEALRATLVTIVRRHESLRTTFAQRDGFPFQQITPADKAAELVRLSVRDLSELSAMDQRVATRQWVNEESARPFDLSAGPLLRINLLRLNLTEHVLAITMHHIISDGWSIGVLVKEVAELYPACLAGRPSPLPELEIQYADFAAWQRQWLTGDTLETQLSYWRKQLAGAGEEVLLIPTDRPRPPLQTANGAQLGFTLSEDLSRRLMSFGNSEGVTLFMVILAAFQTLLFRYSSQDRISVGTPIANRVRRETEALIGLFVNTLVMRSDFSSDPTFRELLQQVREVCLGAYAHQDVPFERLVDELQVERDLSRSPLFQVMCALQNTPQVELKLPGLELREEPRDAVVAKFDLTLSLAESATGLAGSFEYNTDLFDRVTIERMAGHFQSLLENVLADPDRHVSSLGLLTESEREQLLVSWNQTATEFPEDECLHEAFEKNAATTPDAIAVIFETRQVNYGELDARANQLAHYLRAIGVGPETIVGICLERSPDMICGLLAILKAGGAYLPLDPSYPKERLAFMLDDSKVETVLTETGLVNLLKGYDGRLVCLDKWSQFSNESAAKPVSRATPDNAAYVIYTSGSTGKPKGVVVTHRNVVNFFTAMDGPLEGESRGTWLALTSLSFDISVLELCWTLARGFRVVLQKEEYQVTSSSRPSIDARPSDVAFSLSYFASNEGATDDGYRLLLEGAKFADQHGFTAVWTPERHFHAFGGLFPNPSVTSAAIAAITERVGIRAGSVVMPLHNPIRVAEEWAVVDRLSNGRVAISFASGWHANDFALAPENYANRKEVWLRDLEVVRRLWRGEAVTVKSGTGDEIAVSIRPRPVQTELPLWLTAAGNPETFRIAGETGAHLLTHLVGQSVEELREKIVLYRDSWNASGHAVGGHVTLMIHTFVGPERNAVKEKVRKPLCDYLKSSLDLRRNLVRGRGDDADPTKVSEEDLETLLSHAFDRYFETNGLFGTPGDCVEMVQQLKRIGVNEIACLIDFGVPTDDVLASLPFLELVKEESRETNAARRSFTLVEQIERHNVTHLQCTPSLARLIATDEAAVQGVRSVRKFLLGGEALTVPVAQPFHHHGGGDLYNMYGPTETTIWSAMHRLDHLNGSIPLGRPIANTTLYVLDARLQPLPIGVPVELYIGGLGVTRGYLFRPGVTAERFLPDPFTSTPGMRLYKTGDRVRYLADGNLEFLGRVDDQVKLGGHRIEPGEIEAAISQHPAVREVAVVARGTGVEDTRLVAYVVPALKDAPSVEPYQPPHFDAERLNGDHQYVKLANGMTVAHVSAVHAHAAYREIFEEEVYLKHGVTLADGDCVFDVGANIGMFSLFVSQHCKGASIHAFEPIPITFAVLRANAELYQLKADLYECGLAQVEGDDTFTFYPELPGMSGRYSDPQRSMQIARTVIAGHGAVPDYFKESLERGELDEALAERFGSRQFTCRLRTLSSIIKEKWIEQIDLLKIDVEGSELDVLRGIQDDDWRKIKQIVMEVETKTALDEISSLLSQHDFGFTIEEMLNVRGQDGPGIDVYMLYGIQRTAARHEVTYQSAAKGSVANAHTPALAIGDLRTYLESKLPSYMIPSSFIFLPKLPLTPNGKLDHRALLNSADQIGDQVTEASYVAPQTEMEKLIASIWQRVLRREQVGIHENFFALGGNSLNALQVHSELRKQLDREMPIIVLFRHPTLEALAQHLSQVEHAETDFEHIRQQAQRQKEALVRRNQQVRTRKANS